jgi:hypothetical protein
MSWTGFNNLDLTEVEAEKGRSTLEPGSYTVKIVEALVNPAKNDSNGRVLALKFEEVNGKGSANDNINLVNRNPDATKIGLARLKAMLVAAGHPNPDRPGDVKSMIGLKVGLHIEQDADWTDRDGKLRKGGGKPRRSGAYFKPSDLSDAGASAGRLRVFDDDLNDDIPF